LLDLQFESPWDSEKWESHYNFFWSDTGLLYTQPLLDKIRKDFSQINYAEAKPIWENEFPYSATKF
jgi:hypothetical protein